MASPAATMGRKRAVLVGINYLGTHGELKGCINDVVRMRRCLVDRFGFDDADIRVLTNADPSTRSPRALTSCWSSSGSSGPHCPGTPSSSTTAATGCWFRPRPARTTTPATTSASCHAIPTSSKVPDGCLFTMVSDSCFSGGLIDKTKEQIGNSTKQSKARPPPASGACLCLRGALECIGIGHPRRAQKMKPPAAHAAVGASRSLPLSTYIRMLKEQTGKDDVGVGSIRTTLFHHFGDDGTPKIKKFAKAMAGGKLRHSPDQVVVPAGATSTALTPNAMPDGVEAGEQAGALGPAMDQEVHSVEEVYAGAAARVAPPPPPRNGVLISGCQTDETSAELIMADGAYYGALSTAIQAVLSMANRRKVVTNRELVLRVRSLLSRKRYVQHPGLYCSDEHADAAFIC
ncbi:unnamed protein product [Alopecurus aequalis]